jgi:hypothetical protein
LEVSKRRWKLVVVEIGFLEEDDVVVGMGAGIVECFQGGGFPFGAILGEYRTIKGRRIGCISGVETLRGEVKRGVGASAV